MPYLLSLDQGTTSSRAVVFDETCRAVATAQLEFQQAYPKPGWVEHNPEHLWQSQLSVALQALEKAGLTAADIAAIGIANQRETTVLWDRATGRPVCNAIVWQDRRTAPNCEHLRAQDAERLILARTGLLLDPYFSATKLAWMLDNVPGARARAEHGELAFGTVDTWLLWRLTGGAMHATDASNASRTMLFDIHHGDWDPHLLDLFRIPRAVLPKVVDSTGLIAIVSAVPELKGVPIAGIAGDQQAALFGQACFSPGMAKNTYGTGCFLLLHTGDRPVRSKNRMLTTVAWRADGKLEYALEGSVFVGGAIVQWLRDGLGLVKSAGEIEQLAASVPDCGGACLVPALTGLGAPHWDPLARGAIYGLTRGTTAAHIARAALMGIALQCADVLEAMEKDCGRALKELRVDGGASANNLLMQFQADLLGVPVVRPQTQETTALGAACLAGLGVGLWPDRAALAARWTPQTTFTPAPPSDEIRNARKLWTKALERTRGWAGT